MCAVTGCLRWTHGRNWTRLLYCSLLFCLLLSLRAYARKIRPIRPVRCNPAGDQAKCVDASRRDMSTVRPDASRASWGETQAAASADPVEFGGAIAAIAELDPEGPLRQRALLGLVSFRPRR